MAAKEINDAGGLEVGGKKYKLEVVALDDKYSPSEAAVNAKRLRAQYKAPVVFCPHSGGNFAMQAFNEQDGFLIGAYTSVPQMTERGNKLTLRIPPSFAGYIAALHQDRDGDLRQEARHGGRRPRLRQGLGRADRRRPGSRRAARSWPRTRCPTTRTPTSIPASAA